MLESKLTAYAENETIHITSIEEHYILTLDSAQRLIGELHAAVDSARSHQIFSLSAAVSVLEDCIKNLAKETSYGK